MAFRIAKPSWGPLNPPKREDEANRGGWGRFDVVGQQTVYGAKPEEAAYAESLASLRLAVDVEKTLVGEVFDESVTREAQRPLHELVEEEWIGSSHMAPNKLPAGWRHDRLLYRLALPETDWFVDICHADSLAALKRQFEPILPEYGVSQLTMAHLASEDRDLTTRFSEWIWGLTFDDGARPHGVRFVSKHGSNYQCFAIYLRALGDGKTVADEPTKSDDGTVIMSPTHNEALERVVTNFGISRLY